MKKYEVQIQNNRDNSRFNQEVFADSFAQAVDSVKRLYGGWNVEIVGGWESIGGSTFDGDKTPGAAENIDKLEVEERCGVECSKCGRMVNNVQESIHWNTETGEKTCIPCIEKRNVKVGDKVRSFDFPQFSRDLEGDRANYVEGEVVEIHQDGIVGVQSCALYEIRVKEIVRNGKRSKDVGPYATVYPPVNGIESTFGGLTDAVEKL